LEKVLLASEFVTGLSLLVEGWGWDSFCPTGCLGWLRNEREKMLEQAPPIFGSKSFREIDVRRKRGHAWVKPFF
jgi:hypothetical protein